MSKKGDDQKAYAERAMRRKLDQERDTSPNHPPPGKTPDKGFHPVEREDPIDFDEKAND